MPLLFSYGTLRDPAVQRRVFGRELAGRADALLGFTRRHIEISDTAFAAANGSTHVIVEYTGRDVDRTPGTVLEVTEEELAMADAYEPAEYGRIEARFASGRNGWVYTQAGAPQE